MSTEMYELNLYRKTYIHKGSTRLIVQTVGQYCPLRGDQPQYRGVDNYYTTHVFRACLGGDGLPHIEGSRPVETESPSILRKTNAPLDAVCMHELIVKEMYDRIKNGDFTNG